MLEWFQESFADGPTLQVRPLLDRLLVAFLLGCIVSGIYRWTRRNDPPTGRFVSTLVLITILIALVTQIIGNSVARAFSLVGTLSIVRFRTVVEDTRDTAFVIFAVVLGMSLGSGHLIPALTGLVVAGLAAILINPTPATVKRAGLWRLTVRVGVARDPAALLADVLPRFLDQLELRGAATARQGAAVDLSYTGRLRNGCTATALIGELHQLEGVQSVELTQQGE
jgi:hypothetical protein